VEKVLPSQVTVTILNRAAQETIGKDLSLPQSALRDALNPDVFVRTRVTTGSVAPNEVDRMLASEHQGLEQMTAWLSAEKKRITDATRKLDEAIRKITG
jgi:argininosuccinate lyase